MHVLHHLGVGADILVVPERRGGQWRIIRADVDRAVLGAYDSPTAFRLGLSHGGNRVGPLKAHASAMRDLIEAIGRRDRSDRDRLEEYVVARIVRHRGLVSSDMLVQSPGSGSRRLSTGRGFSLPPNASTFLSPAESLVRH